MQVNTVHSWNSRQKTNMQLLWSPIHRFCHFQTKMSNIHWLQLLSFSVSQCFQVWSCWFWLWEIITGDFHLILVFIFHIKSSLLSGPPSPKLLSLKLNQKGNFTDAQTVSWDNNQRMKWWWEQCSFSPEWSWCIFTLLKPDTKHSHDFRVTPPGWQGTMGAAGPSDHLWF